MAQFIDLTSEEQATLLHYVDRLLRPVMGDLARTLSRISAVVDDYNAQSSVVLALLDTGAEIPDNSGLAGTAILDKEDTVAFSTQTASLLTDYYTSTHRQAYVKAAGAENTIG